MRRVSNKNRKACECIVEFIKDKYQNYEVNKSKGIGKEPEIGVEYIWRELWEKLDDILDFPWLAKSKQKAKINYLVNYLLDTNRLERSLGRDDYSGKECWVFNIR